MFGGVTSLIKSQDKIDKLGTYCFSSIRVAFIIKKNSYQKITLTLIQTVRPNHIALNANKQAAHSAENGALAPVFEKSATDVKPN